MRSLSLVGLSASVSDTDRLLGRKLNMHSIRRVMGHERGVNGWSRGGHSFPASLTLSFLSIYTSRF